MFLHVDKMLGADVTVKIIRTLCNFRKMDKIHVNFGVHGPLIIHNFGSGDRFLCSDMRSQVHVAMVNNLS